MLKILIPTAFAAALFGSMPGLAVAKTLPPPAPPQTRYEMPAAGEDYPGARLGEGRSVYEWMAPGTHWRGVDERGYPSGLQENPQIGG